MSRWIKCSDKLPEKKGEYLTINMDNMYPHIYSQILFFYIFSVLTPGSWLLTPNFLLSLQAI